jgi:hypothetical protein
MGGIRWQLVLGLSLVALSGLLYLFHYTLFRDVHHIFIYMVGDIAFVPIEVLLVTLIIHRLLSQRERRSRLEKLNMVIGTFFSEVGTQALAYFSDCDPNLEEIRRDLVVTTDWSEHTFRDVSRRLGRLDYGVKMESVNLEHLRVFLIERRDFLLRLLENPSLLEHESFTDLLRAVFHLTEELAHRDDLAQLPETDYAHLSGDIKRAYVLLVGQWLQYMKHLKDYYPYLFSLAMRTNPFDRTASAIVR